LYTCTVACPPGNPLTYKAAYAVSYNRPFDGTLTTDGGNSYFFYAEYQLVRWLEKNGYDASYVDESTVGSASGAALLEQHKLFVDSAHDEYWSAGQRANVLAARDAGVNLAFFSGNEIFWKTRWATSSFDASTPNRTLITYKETHFNAPTDPSDPPTWTGTWADPRFSPPADGGVPANALTGQQYDVNAGTRDITVPGQYAKLRFWRNTAIASLGAGETLTLDPNGGTLGYEWDEDMDNGFRPAGEFDLSSTTVGGLETFTDYGSIVAENQTATHNLTLYRAPSGALVFATGTVQWAWGLDNTNAWGNANTDPSKNPPDPNMQQATVNILAALGVQPGSLDPSLTAASASSDTTPPSATITSPSADATETDGSTVTVSGTATDAGGGVVAGVEVSTDGGSTWHPATITTPDDTTVNWSYNWVAHGYPQTTILARATDDSANLGGDSSGVTVGVTCSCSIFGNGTTPLNADGGDPLSAELGVKFTTSVPGVVTGIRFFKSAANTGTHIGNLWTAGGQLLGSATFTNETSSGWQQVTFSNPVAITPDTTYIASYFDPSGHYSSDVGYFYSPPPVGGHALDAPPLHAVPADPTTNNGVYVYTSSSTFPSTTYQGTNYYVDVSFTPSGQPPDQVTGVHATAGAGQATLTWSAPAGGTVTKYTITPYLGSTAQPAITLTGNPPATSTTILGLTPGASYTFVVTASGSGGSGQPSAPSNAVTIGSPTSTGGSGGGSSPAGGGVAGSSSSAGGTPAPGATSSTACLSARTVSLRVRAPHGQRLARVTLSIGGHTLRVVRFSHKGVSSTLVRLTGLPPGSFTLTVKTRTATGRTSTAKHRYPSACAAR
jgi:Domain of unknown function (DUF4082)/Bacterial Ig domain/Fibronectin type III domain